MIYLDNAATTYPKPECVYKKLDEANRNAFNPGRGSYKQAKKMAEIEKSVRDKILKLNNISNASVVYTCSATRALNDIIFGMQIGNESYIYVSPFEHNSIIRPLEELQRRKKIIIKILPFDSETWEPDIEKIKNMFAIYKPSAIFISQVSNVTGYILPYMNIFSLGEKYNSINVLDSSQGYGIVEIKDVSNINYIIFAGHKSLYASFGIAGFIKLKQDKLNQNIFGGTGSDTMNANMPKTFPDGYEAGSTNIVAVQSLDASIDWLKSVDIFNSEKIMTKYLINELLKLENIKIFIPKDKQNIIGVISIGIKNYLSDDVGKILNDEFDICVRTGYHCTPLVHDFIKSIEYKGTVRIGLNYFNTKEDIDKLIIALKSLI